jgi:Flp pilus assembly pilin Flp
MLKLRSIKSAKRGASLLEYGTLLGLVSAVAVGAVLSFGGGVSGAQSSANVAIDTAVNGQNTFALAPSDTNGTSGAGVGGVLGDSGSAVATSSLFKWSLGEFVAAPVGDSGDRLMHSSDSTVGATYRIFSGNGAVEGTGTYNTAVGSWAYFDGANSGMRMAGTGSGIEVSFSEPARSVQFKINDVDGQLYKPAVVRNGRVIVPAQPAWRDTIRVLGLNASGEWVAPQIHAGLTSAPVSNVSPGVYRGYDNRNCNYGEDCGIGFLFGEPVSKVQVWYSVNANGGVVDVSDIFAFFR